MLSYALAIAVALSSLVLFSTAFLMSKIHRKDDFLWSGVGLFYALVLWFCARNITGAVLLGQAAATVLLLSYNWQTIKLRRAIANPAQAAEINNFSVVQSVNGLLKRKKNTVQPSVQPVVKTPQPKVTEESIAIPETPVEIAEEERKEQVISDKDNNISSDSNLAEVTESSLPEQKIDSTNQEAPIPSEPLPLPNKLPETVESDRPPEKLPTREDVPERSPQPEILNDLPTPTPTEEVVPTPEINPPEIVKSSKPESPLDSLETVEVAEVLEAEENRQSNRPTDRSNIIEVTSTEVTNPEQRLDSTQDV